MAENPSGFYFDDLNKIRVLEPQIGQQTQELKDECKEFVDSKSDNIGSYYFWRLFWLNCLPWMPLLQKNWK